MSEIYTFPTCIHYLSAAMHIEGINPQDMKISLPRSDWWKLQCALDRKYKFAMRFDGRGPLVEEFQYMGIKFVPEDKK